VTDERAREVAVCSACKRASCFQGVWFCEEARSASVVWLSVDVLRELDREHPCYWRGGGDGA
jgi:hypothetical protein